MIKDHCDACGKTRPTRMSTNDWFILNSYGDIDVCYGYDRDRDHHFCSYKCLLRWARIMEGE